MNKWSKQRRTARSEIMHELEQLHSFELRLIPRYPNYAASSDGRIWDVFPHDIYDEDYGLTPEEWAERPPFPIEDREVKPYVGKSGYKSVWLSRGKRRPKYLPVHRLMAQCFLDERPSPKHLIRHLDGDCHNNVASNLQWGTHAENAADRKLHAQSYDRLTPEQKAEIATRLGTEEREFLAKEFNVSFLTINNIWKSLK